MINFAQIEIALGESSTDSSVMGYGLAINYLRERGINEELIDALGIRICFASDLFKWVSGRASGDDRLAIVFPYHKMEDEYYDWWAARLVATHKPTGFAALAKDKRGKMFCPPGEPLLAYLPRNLNWPEIPVDSNVYIHESAIKAINGARLGFWSVGLNGVRGWSAAKHGRALVEGLSDIPWKTKKLNPIIVFDSNVETNPDVLDARTRLAAKLLELTGRASKYIDVPAHVDAAGARVEQGYDDYCVRMGDEEGCKLLESEALDVEVGDYELALNDMNSKVVIVRNISRVVEVETGTMMTRAAFVELNYSHVTIAKEDGEGRVNFPRLWLMDPRRQEVEKMEYTPGAPKLTKDRLNLWNGMGTDPAKGDVSKWLEVLERGVPDPGLRRWVMQWFAYPLQNLGAKLTTYLHMYSCSGTGKNALLTPIIGIYGSNGVHLGKERIASDFNEVYVSKQFVNLDELQGGNEPGAASLQQKIKLITTSPTIMVNGKGKAEYETRNHINLVTTSNYVDSNKLDDGDRRCCVIQFGTRENLVKDREYWTAYHDWATSEEGQAALYDYLLNVDCSDFDPKGWAYDTKWKEIVTDSTRGAMEKFVRDLWDDPSLVLPALLDGAKVLTNDQLAIAYMPEESHRITPGLKNALGQRMQDIGFEKVQIKIDGSPKRLWLIDRSGSLKDNDAIRAAYAKIHALAKAKY